MNAAGEGGRRHGQVGKFGISFTVLFDEERVEGLAVSQAARGIEVVGADEAPGFGVPYPPNAQQLGGRCAQNQVGGFKAFKEEIACRGGGIVGGVDKPGDFLMGSGHGVHAATDFGDLCLRILGETLVARRKPCRHNDGDNQPRRQTGQARQSSGREESKGTMNDHSVRRASTAAGPGVLVAGPPKTQPPDFRWRFNRKRGIVIPRPCSRRPTGRREKHFHHFAGDDRIDGRMRGKDS